MTALVNPTNSSLTDLKLSAPRIVPAVLEAYPDNHELRTLAFWLNDYIRRVPTVLTQSLKHNNIDARLCVDVWTGKAESDQQREFVKQVRPFREKCGAANCGSYARTSFIEVIHHQMAVARFHSQKADPYLLIILGGAGCGKSTGLRTGAQLHEGELCYWRARNAGGIKGMAKQICRLNGADANMNSEYLNDFMHRCFGPGRGLAVDEAHMLIEKQPEQKKIEALRGIADERQTCVIMAFTDEQMEAGFGRSGYNFNQLAWRGRFIRLKRQGTESDIRAIFPFRCPDLTLTPELFELLKAVNEHSMGGFGGVNNVIKDAIFEAEFRKVDLTEKILMTSIKKQYGLEARDAAGNITSKAGSKEVTLKTIQRYQRR